MMFDDVFGMVQQCTESFRGSVRDTFGASIVADVLDPIRDEIGLLRSFNEEVLRQSLSVGQVLREARSLTIDEGGTR
jgi:hypothetical protein